MTISNHISLDELRRMAVGDIAALPPEQLALLQDKAAGTHADGTPLLAIYVSEPPPAASEAA